MIIVPHITSTFLGICPYCHTIFIIEEDEFNKGEKEFLYYTCCPNENCREKISMYHCHPLMDILY